MKNVDVKKLPENPYMAYIEMQEKARKKQKALEEELRRKQELDREQAKLDFQKWLDSERKEVDMSGSEPWCYFCSFRKDNVKCGCDPELRTANAMCVDAYHIMQDKLSK